MVPAMILLNQIGIIDLIKYIHQPIHIYYSFVLYCHWGAQIPAFTMTHTVSFLTLYCYPKPPQ